MKMIIKILVLVVFPILANAQATSDDEKTLMKLNENFIRNSINNDTVAHNKIIHPTKFLLIDGDGSIMGRKDYMLAWAHGYDKKTTPEFECRDTQVRLFGETALVISKTHFRTQRDGKWGTGETRYTDTYIRESGRWWCVQAQLTRLPFVFD